MRNRPPDYEPDDDDSGLSRRLRSVGGDRANRRLTTIFACVVLGAILLTIIALALGK
jgi:hypothetical protein